MDFYTCLEQVDNYQVVVGDSAPMASLALTTAPKTTTASGAYYGKFQAYQPDEKQKFDFLFCKGLFKKDR